MDELEKAGVHADSFSAGAPELRNQAIREAIIQAMHYHILFPVNGRYQATVSPRVKYRLLKGINTLTEEEAMSARRAAWTARQPETAATE